jgi:hypothetical protein
LVSRALVILFLAHPSGPDRGLAWIEAFDKIQPQSRSEKASGGGNYVRAPGADLLIRRQSDASTPERRPGRYI